MIRENDLPECFISGGHLCCVATNYKIELTKCLTPPVSPLGEVRQCY